MTHHVCGICHHYTGSRGTYGLCGPFTWNLREMPWWSKRPQLETQTYVRPDEGKDCAAWTLVMKT